MTDYPGEPFTTEPYQILTPPTPQINAKLVNATCVVLLIQAGLSVLGFLAFFGLAFIGMALGG